MEPDSEIAFPKLTESEINALRKFGSERQVSEGEMLFKEGDRDLCFFATTNGNPQVVVLHAHIGKL